MKKTTAKHHMDGVFVLLCFCVFAACVLMVLLTGAKSYRGLVSRDAASYSRSIAVRYVTAKIRHADAENCVFVGSFSGDNLTAEDGNTLFLAEKVDGQTYYTRIYYYKGYIRELFTAASDSFSRADGDTVLKAKKLRFTLERKTGLLTIFTTDADGRTATATLSLRSGEAAE